jgi:hypothetical protein
MPLEELKDVRPPVDLPPNYFWLFVLLGLLIVVGLIFLVRWLRGKMTRQKAKPVIVRPAWEIAREELAALEKENLPGKGNVEAYFVRLSAIIRHYLERRFSLSAPEMTTDEFLLHIKTSTVLNLQQKDSLREFLTVSDMVKFARYSSSSKEMDDALVVANRLIEETIPQPDPVSKTS